MQPKISLFRSPFIWGTKGEISRTRLRTRAVWTEKEMSQSLRSLRKNCSRKLEIGQEGQDFYIVLSKSDTKIKWIKIPEALKGNSQLRDRADLDATFAEFKKRLPQPEIKHTRRIHLEIRFNLA